MLYKYIMESFRWEINVLKCCLGIGKFRFPLNYAGSIFVVSSLSLSHPALAHHPRLPDMFLRSLHLCKRAILLCLWATSHPRYASDLPLGGEVGMQSVTFSISAGGSASRLDSVKAQPIIDFYNVVGLINAFGQWPVVALLGRAIQLNVRLSFLSDGLLELSFIRLLFFSVTFLNLSYLLSWRANS